jgi:hypothetical protein
MQFQEQSFHIESRLSTGMVDNWKLRFSIVLCDAPLLDSVARNMVHLLGEQLNTDRPQRELGGPG